MIKVRIKDIDWFKKTYGNRYERAPAPGFNYMMERLCGVTLELSGRHFGADARGWEWHRDWYDVVLPFKNLPKEMKGDNL